MEQNYRTRIYDNYVYGRKQPIGAESLAGLKPRAPYLRKMIRNHFPADRSSAILDLGCGHGAVLYFAREAGYRNVRGVDASPEQVGMAKQLGIEGVRKGDLIDALHNESHASLDLIVSFDVIEHFSKKEIVPFVDEVKRALRPDGTWIIHTANGESPFGSRMLYWDFTHELAFTHNSICHLLLSSGFSNVTCYEDKPVVHGLKSAVRWALWLLIRSVLWLYIAVETGNTSRDHIFSQCFLAVATK